MLFPIDDARIGRAVTQREYTLTLEEVACLLARASRTPHPLDYGGVADHDLVTDLMERTWNELALIDFDLFEEARLSDEPVHATWQLHLIENHVTKENN